MPKGGDGRGYKQSVKRKKRSSKKKKFRGVPKQAKVVRNRQKKAPVGITFVGEDDVVSEQVPPPPTPASLRKLNLPEESYSDETYECEIAAGYRLVSMKSLQEFVGRVHARSGCDVNEGK